MAGSAKLAELFVDITMRGGAKVQLKSLRDQIQSFDNSLKNNASLYKRQTDAKLDQLNKIAAREKEIAKLDQATYGSKKYANVAANRADTDFERMIAGSKKKSAIDQAMHANFMKNFGSRKQVGMVEASIQAEKNKQQQDELKLLQRTTMERGKGMAVLQLLKNRMASGNTAAMGGAAGGSSLSGAASLAGLAVPAAAITAAVTAAIYMGIQLAKGASPNAAATYEGSWKMLTNEIGQSLIPALTNLSKTLQNAAIVWRNAKNSAVGAAAGTVASAAWNASVPGMAWNYATWLLSKAAGDQGGMLTSNDHKANFISFEEGWRRVQQDAASGGSLEAKLLQQAILGNQIAAQSAASLNTIAGNPPVPPGNVP